MLTNRPFMAILPVADLERARKFYEGSLGLWVANEPAPPDAVVLEAGRGAKIELLRRDRPSHSEYTSLSFEVDDIEREIGELERRGVRFEDYDLPGLRTEHHVATTDGMKAAWFKDPDGNILCIHQRAS